LAADDLGAGRDGQHGTGGDLQQALSDAAEEQAAEGRVPTGRDHDELGLGVGGRLGDSLGDVTDPCAGDVQLTAGFARGDLGRLGLDLGQDLRFDERRVLAGDVTCDELFLDVYEMQMSVLVDGEVGRSA